MPSSAQLNRYSATAVGAEEPPEVESDAPPAGMEGPLCNPILLLPEDALHNVFGRLSLRQALACRPVCRLFRDALSYQPFLASLPPLRLLALRHPRPVASARPSLHAFDPFRHRWLRLPLSFLPCPSTLVTSSPSLLYLWLDNPGAATCNRHVASAGKHHSQKSLAVCNPITGSYHLLPPLGSAWSRHGTVIAGPGGTVLVLTELASLTYAPGPAGDRWLKSSLNLPSKPRSPILMAGSIFALCDVGTRWRNQWKIFSCRLPDLGRPRGWAPVERQAWGDVFEILKRPRLLPGAGNGRILMIGGLRSSFAADAPCSTVLILRLDLATMDWEEAGRMPMDMYRFFAGAIGGGGQGSVVAAAAAVAGASSSNKVKVFGGDGQVWFSGRKVRGKLALWEEEEVGSGGSSGCGRWSWIDGVPGYNESVYRGFILDAGFATIP